jgi:hypothetical protein
VIIIVIIIINMIRDNQIYMISLDCTRVEHSEAFREVHGAEDKVPGAEDEVPGAEDEVPGAEDEVPGAEDTRGGRRTFSSLKLVS